MPAPGDDPPSILRAIETRRTARRFDPSRPLARDRLLRLIDLARLAPSPLNLQPWRFIIVRDPRNRRKLRGCCFGDARLTDAPAVVIVLAYHHPDRVDLAGVIDRMEALGAIGPGESARFRATASREWSRNDGPAGRAARSAMLAVATLMIAAEAEGLASSWLEGFDAEPLRQGFGIPDDHAVCGLLALGHALEPAPFPGRIDLDRVAFAEHFGRPLDQPGDPE